MSAIDQLLRQQPYATRPGEHRELFAAAMQGALQFHTSNCEPYARWFKKQGGDPDAAIEDLTAVPYLPVSIFKRMSLESVPEAEVVRVLKSSATSSQTPSRVVLDRVTRDRQMRVLGTLLSALIGSQRRPFVVLDAAASPSGDVELSARVAGMRGYLMMASETDYVMQSENGQLRIDVDKLDAVLRKFREANLPVVVIGYTYILYQYVIAPLLRMGRQFPLPAGSMVLHFGGWKRLQSQAVNRAQVNRDAAEVFAVAETSIRDVYGFTEQLGVIYPDNGYGVRLAPAYAEVIVRDPITLEALPEGETGLLEFITPLPHSYPGMALLVDDMGRIVSRDGSENGQFGTRFEVVGRAQGSEIRGCGDTLAEQVYEVRA